MKHKMDRMTPQLPIAHSSLTRKASLPAALGFLPDPRPLVITKQLLPVYDRISTTPLTTLMLAVLMTF
jgi:hypothetical protein